MPFKEARLALPNMPEEMFLLWLDDRIRSNGWPPNGLEWEGFLFGHSLSYWQQLEWELKPINISTNDLCHESEQLVIQIIDACVYKNNNIIAQYIPDIRERFQGILEFIVENHELPGPIILLNQGDCFQLVDGSHRFSVLEALRASKATSHYTPAEFMAYVGTIK